MRRARFLAPWVLLGLAACVAPGVTVSQSRMAADYAGNARRLVVVNNLLDEPVLPNFDGPFAAAMTGELGRCGVTARVIRSGKADTSPAGSDPAPPDASLVIAPARITNYVNGARTIAVAAIYFATLTDRATGRQVWRAEFQLERGVGRTVEQVAALSAGTLVGRMASDHALRSCPANPAV